MEQPFVYVVFCHHRPELVLRLARRIRALSPAAVVLLRHDRGEGFLDPAAVAAAGALELRSGIHMAWASWAMVDGMVEAFARAVDEHGAAWVVAVSGQDYPVADLAAWEAGVRAGGVAALVDAVTDPAQTERYRYAFRLYPGLRWPRALPRPVRRGLLFAWYRGAERVQHRVVLNRLLPTGWAVGVRRRSTPFDATRPCWKGAQWMTLSARAVEAVRADHPDGPLASYFRRTFVPDEGYLQTLLHASGLTVATAPTSHVVFDGWQGHPRTLTDQQVHDARAAGAPFSRKADDRTEPGALDLADHLTAGQHLHG